MTSMQVYSITLFAFTFFYLALSLNTVKKRMKYNISLLDGGNPDMLVTIRAHGNFSEYVPFALILIYALVVNNAPVFLVALLCGVLFIARCMHAYALLFQENLVPAVRRYRFFGELFTFIVMGVTAIALLLLLFV